MTDFREHLRDSRSDAGSSQPYLEQSKAPDYTYHVPSFAQVRSGGLWIPYGYLVWMLEIVQTLVIAGGARIRIHMPAAHGKSQAISLWFLVWYLTWFPDHSVILTSYNESKATDWSVDVRDELGVYRGKATDTPPAMVNPKHSGVTKWRTGAKGRFYAAGVSGPITGRHADLYVVDDPHKDWLEAHSPVHLERLRKWIYPSLFKRLKPNASVIVIMTRWHDADFSAMLDEYGDWTDLVLPRLALENDPVGRPEGEALNEERHPRKEAEAQREHDPEAFEAMDQQNPSSKGGKVWDVDWFKRYEVVPDGLKGHIQSWDMTFKETTTGSFVVGQVWAKAAKGPDVYLLHQVRRRVEFFDALKLFRSMTKAYPQAKLKLVESAANGEAVISTLKREIGGIRPVQVKGSKPARARSVAPFIEAGNVWIPSPKICPWVTAFLNEVSKFPLGKDDDQVDCASQALQRLTGRTVFRVGSV
jgi:predicted phage terminase large subunit-like protein